MTMSLEGGAVTISLILDFTGMRSVFGDAT